MHPWRLGVIGVGNRGTALLRALLELPGTPIVAVCDTLAKHRQRGQAIVEKLRGQRPDAHDDPRQVFERTDIDAVVVALPCDLHEAIYHEAVAAGKHLYAEKPLALTLEGCDRLISESSRMPGVVVHIGYQRRSNPRFREGVELIRRGELGPLIETRASWNSSNGPLAGQGDGSGVAIGRETGWSSKPCISGTYCNGSRVSRRCEPAAGVAAICSRRLIQGAT